MKPALIIIAIITTCLTYAAALTAPCPQDGETANYTGGRTSSNGGQSFNCEYKHRHYEPNDTVGTIHTFWIPCGD